MAKRPPKRKPTPKPKAKPKPKTGVARKPAAKKPAVKRKPTTQRKPTVRRKPAARSKPVVVVPPEPPTPIPTPTPGPRQSAWNKWWPVVAVFVLIAVVATAAIIRFTDSDSSSDVADQGFTADFPTEPEEGSSSFTFGDVAVTTRIFMSETGEGSNAVGVGVTSLPTDLELNASQIRAVLDSAANTSVGALGYKIKERKEATFDGDPALDFRATGDPQIVYVSRLIYHDGRIFQLIGIGTSGAPPSAYDQFVESFRFTDE